ncbi:MAG: polyhydroxyalkanoate synthase [Pseudohongiellaceae bacterium]|jgi:polyhydroxyalkanoate synthase
MNATTGSADNPAVSQEKIDALVEEVIEKAIERNIPGLARLPLTEAELEVGTSEKELIYTSDTARLYHYNALADEVYRVPVLLVMSPLAKGYILDLAKGQSLVEYFLENGHDVYMIDWAAPQKKHKDLNLASYACDMVGDCIEQVIKDSGEPDVSLVGYCMGGLLSVCYAALNPAGPVKNLACFTTPVNGDGMVLFKRWLTSKSFDIDRLVAELGVIPTEVINASLQALRPLQRNANQLKLLNNVDNDEFVKAHLRFERWAVDQLPFPGALAKEFMIDFIRDNKLIKKEMMLRGRVVDLSKITVPFLHVAASFDHIVPAAASKDLIDMVGSQDKEEIIVRGGHVSLVAGGNAIYRLWPRLNQWISERAN